VAIKILRVRIEAPAEYACVMREEVTQPIDAARRPYVLAVSVQAMDDDDATVELAANAQPGSKKHTRRAGWCLELPVAGRVQLQSLTLLTDLTCEREARASQVIVASRCLGSGPKDMRCGTEDMRGLSRG
jgi:hypothetical protein